MAFERVSPESVGIRSEDIRSFLKESYKAGIQLHSFMLIRHGKVAAEGWYHPYTPDARHIIYSFSKTFTQTAIGFAVQEGILSLDEKLVDLFPEELPEKISENLALADIESLLTMSCGHEAELTTEDIENRGGNWVKAFFEQPFKYRPHTMFQYNTTGTDLLCLILMKKTGQTLTQFLTPRLFEPLGIRKPLWEFDPLGYTFGAGGLFLNARELHQLGLLYLQEGLWHGKQLVPSQWVRESSAKQAENGQFGYGYLFWLGEHNSYRADGKYCQWSVVLRDRDAVITVTAECRDGERLNRALFDEIYPQL